jgi:hypothetical protein
MFRGGVILATLGLSLLAYAPGRGERPRLCRDIRPDQDRYKKRA